MHKKIPLTDPDDLIKKLEEQQCRVYGKREAATETGRTSKKKRRWGSLLDYLTKRLCEFRAIAEYK